MAENRKVIIDAGHGGQEPGAVYEGRQEKEDALRLAFDVGNALERRGISVSYTRVSDVYDSPYEKAAMANASDADIFLSIHRNAMPVRGTASGIENLVYEDSGTAGALGRNIGEALAEAGWTDLGVKERPGLVVLRNTKIPAVLVEVGFINNEKDNEFLDANMAATADAIADGVLKTFRELDEAEKAGRPGGETSRPAEGTSRPGGETSQPAEGTSRPAVDANRPGGETSQPAEESSQPASETNPSSDLYVVQTGVYRQRKNAEAELLELRELGCPAYLTAKNGLFYVQAGAFRNLDNAVRMEQSLRRLGYGTVILTALGT